MYVPVLKSPPPASSMDFGCITAVNSISCFVFIFSSNAKLRCKKVTKIPWT